MAKHNTSLPKYDRAAEIETLSFRAVENLLPSAWFIFRDDRAKDFGGDASLEVVADGFATNIRAQAQIKASETASPNKDGSISLSVKTANLNYLKNWFCSLYFLYIVGSDEVRYLWTRDVRQTNPGSASTSLRFIEVLNGETSKTIYDRILEEARYLDAARQLLELASRNEASILSIDAESLEVLNTAERIKALTEKGLSIVASGRAKEILETIDQLPRAESAKPKLALVHSYALFESGRYTECMSALSLAKLSCDQFAKSEQAFLEVLSNAVEYESGRIDSQQYLERAEEFAAKSDSEIALGQVFSALHQRFFAGVEEENARQLLEEIESAARALIVNRDTSSAIKAEAFVITQSLKATLYMSELRSAYFGESMRINMGLQSHHLITPDTYKQEWLKCEAALKPILERSDVAGDNRVSAAAYRLRALARSLVIMSLHAIDKNMVPAVDLAAGVRSDAENAIELYQATGHLQGELSATLLSAESDAYLGDLESAREKASRILAISRAMQYAALIAGANDILEGRLRLSYVPQGDPDLSLSQESDEGLFRYCRAIMKEIGAPPNLEPNVLSEVKFLRMIAGEQFKWCQHIELLHDRAKLPPLIGLMQKPNWTCWCTRFDIKSLISHGDAESVVATFKKNHCSDCKHRAPKVA